MTIHHLTVLARDVARTRRFYCDRLGFAEVDFGTHTQDPRTLELVLRDQGDVYWTFHFYPKAHKAVDGEGGVRSVKVGYQGEEELLLSDPDGLRVLLCPSSVSGLQSVEVTSRYTEFWHSFSGGEVCGCPPDPGPENCSHQLGYGSVHHVGLTAARLNAAGFDLSVSKPTRWGQSRYFYSPCGMLLELVGE